MASQYEEGMAAIDRSLPELMERLKKNREEKAVCPECGRPSHEGSVCGNCRIANQWENHATDEALGAMRMCGLD